MYTEEYDKRPFPFRDFLLKFIIIVIFALLLVWLIPKFISPKTGSNEVTSSKVFEKNFRCPPWNDEYEEGCKEFTGCESCWFGYINSEAK